MGELGYRIDRTAYLPDPDEPVDRWFQASNASNVRTTVGVLALLREVGARIVIDPFAGGGSTAMAARLRCQPFYGIEMNPVLACISLAKAEGRPHHAQLLPDLRDADRPEWLPAALGGISGRVAPQDAPTVAAMAVVAALRATDGRPIDRTTLHEDLTATPSPAGPGRTVCGDAVSESAWKLLDPPELPALVYCSPPFGPSSPSLGAPPAIRQGAAELLGAAGLFCPDGRGPMPGYTDITMGMLHRMVRHVRRGALVLEHEPDDEGRSAVAPLMARIRDELGDVLHSPLVDTYPAFTDRGPFTLITHRIR